MPIGLIAGLLATGTIRTSFPDDPAGAVAIIFANGVLMTFIITEVVRSIIHIVSYRMTA